MLINTENHDYELTMPSSVLSVCVCVWLCAEVSVWHVLYVLCFLRALCLMELITRLTASVSLLSSHPNSRSADVHTHTHTEWLPRRVAWLILLTSFCPPKSLHNTHTLIVPSVKVSPNWKGTWRVQECEQYLCVCVQEDNTIFFLPSGCMQSEVVTAHPVCAQWSVSTPTPTGQRTGTSFGEN